MQANRMELSEGTLAEVVDGMKLISRAEKHFEVMEARLRHCRVSVDDSSFKNIRFYLDKLHAELEPIPLLHAEAVALNRK